MTKKQILNGNLLICEFLGEICNVDYPFNGSVYCPELGRIRVKYHESWDWLMPVVEKIESLKVKANDVNLKDSATVIISNNKCGILNITANCPKTIITDKTKLFATYKAVVKYIKWYNKQIKK